MSGLVYCMQINQFVMKVCNLPVATQCTLSEKFPFIFFVFTQTLHFVFLNKFFHENVVYVQETDAKSDAKMTLKMQKIFDKHTPILNT